MRKRKLSLKTITRETVLAICRNKATSRRDFQRNHPTAYSHALEHGYIEEVNSILDKRKAMLNEQLKHDKTPSFEELKAAASQYPNRSHFRLNDFTNYNHAWRLGIMDQFFPKTKKTIWPNSAIAAEARKYTKRSDFQKGSSTAYRYAVERGIMNEICTHMQPAWSGTVRETKAKTSPEE